MSTQTIDRQNLKREAIVPESKEHWLSLRAKDITSTEIAALFGISPYMSKFELWHRKKEQQTQEIEENERMRWGLRLEDAIAHGMAEDQGWKIRRVNRYIRIPELRIGSSFDFEVSGQDALFEIKNVDGLAFLNGWVDDDGVVEAPPHIELQVQHQLAVSGKSMNNIGALIGGNRPLVLSRPANPKIIDAIYNEVGEFWHSIDADKPPAPDFNRDASFIIGMYDSATAGKVVNAADRPMVVDLVKRYLEAVKSEKAAEAAKEAAKAEILMLVGDAEKIVGPSFSISAGIVKGGPVSFIRNSYRGFRVFEKKSKEAV